MYPLKFEPILKPMLWGGDKIIPFKHLSADMKGVGESWEISDVEDNESIVANGPDKGLNLTQMVRKYREELVGESNYARFGNKFPLLIKFIDAREDLSIQVHPTDELAKKRHNSFGKTEMWYVVDADKGAKLRSGFSEEITSKEYKERVYNNTITDVLQEYDIHPGDVFFLPAGRIHSIGAGAFIAEIQQTSNITYRIYDFNRKDAEGKTRELHTDLAREAINYEVLDDYRTQYETEQNAPVELVACPYFTTSLYDMTEEISCDYSELDSFVIFICVEGACTLFDDQKNEITMKAGETVLFPATTQEVQIIPEGAVKLLETYV
ncbi:type I phosphomannose isomerase catalytic subunit [Bacteroides sp. 224]|uniref:type I phosphomannose isomerase catalytic subunit n=1 Tax=Bacteroides sp. 224 TaxID=2302936 RepID=UPI0013D31A6B|nr:type I phosphomannose isomerase catalytic subunit [Bacteroides sp. 224]NDV66217.1 mannose-6-phosphate isomerase [Bacteroides sp. 224]